MTIRVGAHVQLQKLVISLHLNGRLGNVLTVRVDRNRVTVILDGLQHAVRVNTCNIVANGMGAN